MKFLKDKQTRHDFVTYAMCIVAFAIVFFMQSNHMIPRMIAGQLVQIGRASCRERVSSPV